MSPEEIGGYRAAAQQNSMEAIRAAEERYAKAKETAGDQAKEKALEKVEEAKEAAERAKGKAEAKEYGVEKRDQSKEKLGEHPRDVQEKLRGQSIGGEEKTGKSKSYREKQEKQHEIEGKEEDEEEAKAVEKEKGGSIIQETTTIPGDLCEAVGATVIGIVHTAKEMVVGGDPTVQSVVDEKHEETRE